MQPLYKCKTCCICSFIREYTALACTHGFAMNVRVRGFQKYGMNVELGGKLSHVRLEALSEIVNSAGLLMY